MGCEALLLFTFLQDMLEKIGQAKVHTGWQLWFLLLYEEYKLAMHCYDKKKCKIVPAGMYLSSLSQSLQTSKMDCYRS